MGTTSLTPKSAYREETGVAGFGLSEIFMVILAIRARETPRGSPPKQAGDPKHQKLQYRPRGAVGPTSFKQRGSRLGGKELDRGSRMPRSHLCGFCEAQTPGHPVREKRVQGQRADEALRKTRKPAPDKTGTKNSPEPTLVPSEPQEALSQPTQKRALAPTVLLGSAFRWSRLGDLT